MDLNSDCRFLIKYSYSYNVIQYHFLRAPHHKFLFEFQVQKKFIVTVELVCFFCQIINTVLSFWF